MSVLYSVELEEPLLDRGVPLVDLFGFGDGFLSGGLEPEREGKEGKRERGKEGKRERGKEGKRERGKEGKREELETCFCINVLLHRVMKQL